MYNCFNWAVNYSAFKSRFSELLNNENNDKPTLDEYSKTILKNRYIKMVNAIEIRSRRASFWYSTLSALTTIGSILVPGLLAIQERTFNANSTGYEKIEHENKIYWTTWGISLMVTLSNAMVKLFSFDTTYITRKLRCNHLKSEGWLYLELAGRYSKFETHQDAFKTFCDKIEEIRTEQIKEEYTFNSSSSVPSTNKQVHDENMNNNYSKLKYKYNQMNDENNPRTSPSLYSDYGWENETIPQIEAPAEVPTEVPVEAPAEVVEHVTVI
jgi:hypothetical protein